MPRNLKEELLFTLVMAGLMVLVMAGYNIALNDGFSNGYVMEVLKGYPLALIFAGAVDLIIVGPTVKHIFFKHMINDYMKQKQIRIALVISTMMVLGMVTIMSAFGMVMQQSFGNNILLSYLHIWIFNLILALPLQILLVGPIARKILASVQKTAE
ncbi:DUF2798 domain-containing protein [Lactobacillus terrae]|uniref:DUF2798 domain-containing protein n=1 Tax=Lactobacillus terrae TaxID=2269374 RepID=UPI000C1B73E1|nr:DUF2798 domain-containing protein [Lactobacillus terrae]